jgi:uncharacterized membrane protein YccC
VNRPSAAELLFSAKAFAAAMLALYLALAIGLPRPFWSVLTAYVVSTPLTGAVRSKALYRVAGTFLGSVATVLMVPYLSQAPELLTLALAGWVALCLYISLQDRTPRAYAFMLAGYTAAMIGFPSVSAPQAVFDVALARVEEITLGILCGTIVHTLIFPRSLGPALLGRLDHALADARRWLRDALGGGSDAQERRSLAGDITELRLMATHLPFDTSNLRWTSNTIHALQDRLALLVPILSGIEDRLRALQELGADDPRWRALLDRIVAWSEQPAAADTAPALRREIDQLRPRIAAGSGWADLLRVNLAARLSALIDQVQECRRLRSHIDAGLSGRLPREARAVAASTPRVLHRDRGMALLSAAAAFIAIVSVCAFWILTAWPAGSAAAMMCAVFCSFFASQDDPVPGIRQFLHYTIASMPISAVYLLLIMPAVHNFETLVLVLAPCFIGLGIFVARPTTTGRAMATIFGVAGTLSMHDTGTLDLVSFLNSMLGQLAGISAAALFTRLLRSASAQRTARRLLRAAWDELARLGNARRLPDAAAMSARMVDRNGMLTPRLAAAGAHGDLSAVDALSDLRIGLNMVQLQRLAPDLRHHHGALRRLLRGLSGHFRAQPGKPADAGLLAQIDDALRDVCGAQPGEAQRDAIAALTGIRRGLFPKAPPYASAPADAPEPQPLPA